MDPIHLLAAGAAIVLIDLVLSGDNALVIGAAAARLPQRQQRAALIWGGLGALVFRFALAAVATELLRIPLLEAIGGLVVLGIAIRLALPDADMPRWLQRGGERLFVAILTIMVADVTMSLDNVLAVGALAAGNVPLLAAGLALSVTLLFLASAVVAVLIRRLWWLMDLAILVLGWTAAGMIVQDPWLRTHIEQLGLDAQTQAWLSALVYLVCLVIVAVADIGLHLVPLFRKGRARQPAKAGEPAEALTSSPRSPDAAE